MNTMGRQAVRAVGGWPCCPGGAKSEVTRHTLRAPDPAGREERQTRPDSDVHTHTACTGECGVKRLLTSNPTRCGRTTSVRPQRHVYTPGSERGRSM